MSDNFDNYNSVASTPDMRIEDIEKRLNYIPKQGVGVMYKREWGEKVQKVFVKHRSVMTLFKVKDFYFLYVGAYLPTNSSDNGTFNNALIEISQEIKRLKTKHKEKFAFCVGGDLNIDKKHGPERISIFRQFLTEIEGYHWIPDYPSFEHKHWKTRSYLDGVVISDNIAVDNIRNITETQVEGNRSDHEPVLFDLLIQTRVDKIKKKKTGENTKYIHRGRVNWDLVDRAEYNVYAEDALDKIENNLGDMKWQVKVKCFL